jgi:hypothetical protein
MSGSQTVPEQWLIVERGPDARLWQAIHELRPGAGILLISELGLTEGRRLRHLARLRGLILVEEGRSAARVHKMSELRKALLNRTAMILISPMHETSSHPDWKPLPRMRAAAFARLAKRRAIALGGMDAQRYARLAQLGFIGWAGISAFRT